MPDYYNYGSDYLPYTTSSTDAAAAGISGIFLFVYCCAILAFVIIGAVIYYKIAKKMGYNPWLSLLMFVPFVNFVIPFIVAFTKWPIEEEVERLRGSHGHSKPAEHHEEK